MLRLLIVDDEPIIADGLHELFSSYYGYKLEILRVYSAVEAIRVFNCARIDILITDIEMPELDGISLMNEVRKRWSFCKVVFLTGHDRFNYAYEAISGGVSGFILKSESDEIIIDAIDQCINDIKNENDNEDFLKRLQSGLAESRILMQREIVLSFLKEKISPEITINKLQNLDMPIQPKGKNILICGRVDNKVVLGDIVEKQAKIKTLFHQYTKTIGNGILFFENTDIYFHAIIQPVKNEKHIVTLLSEALEHMQDASFSVTDWNISFIVDNQLVNFTDLPKRFEILTQYLYYWLNWKTSHQLLQIDYFSQTSHGGEGAEIHDRAIRADMINGLRWGLENGDEILYEESAQKMKTMLADLDRHSILRTEILSSAAASLSCFINNRKLEKELPMAIYQAINGLFSRTADEIYQSLLIIGETILSATANIEYSKDEKFIQKIHDYININISKSITLLQLSEYMHFNASYMSRLYKQITGDNLSDTILEKKMLKAEELLIQHPYMKINEVAERTGFHYAAYFAKVFKKRFGLSPQEYRDQLL